MVAGNIFECQDVRSGNKLGLTHGVRETSFFYEKYFVPARRFGKKPGFFVGVRNSYITVYELDR
ncbi:MAG: hypothetical protein HC789_04525 [Microcoleus sp. CSU_2_2]|nr:hypothetical protein [Microcoleus sp. SU_5_3]NJS09692.1 hypothetical protein [Microcoleus sp. CSU_2_2]